MAAHPETYSDTLKTLIANRTEKEKTIVPKMATAMMEQSGIVAPKSKADRLKEALRKK